MRFAYFLSFFDREDPTRELGAAELEGVADIIATTPGLSRGLLFAGVQEVAKYYPNDDTPPQLGMELYFDTIEALEAALARDGHLQALVGCEAVRALAGAEAQQQAMVVRRFKDTPPRSAEDRSFCSYLVHYPGTAEDLNEWLDYYVRNHPQVMQLFPGIREIEVCSRLDWCGFLPWPRVNYMQRNKIAFADVAGLVAAINSPVRAEMTADFNKFPPFEGGNCHYALQTRELELRRDG
ncbi:hypothetical protein [Pseudodonghicola flavimaris]|uniref:Ethyl tert-butyl ether degradation protein EthD n=1 Tax=Pseudodonghicola flavimaris TaxID=3050036 RepID=A0ABT7F098_9RHOB|nr:hypothetical protein [Pseudodonghicola flavimaris]MDK3018028.1 hypothetical protein [Pseudodonghicola flavimaris]